MRLLLEASTLAQWHEILVLAQRDSGIELNQDLESYLVFLTMRFATKPEFWTGSVGLAYLASLSSPGHQPMNHDLREVGDTCLLYAGLFPKHASRKSVPPEYFTLIGQQAYWQLAQKNARDTLFESLARKFKTLSQVLSAIRLSVPIHTISVTKEQAKSPERCAANDEQMH